MTQGREFSEAQGALFQTDEAPVYPISSARMPSYIRDHRARLRHRFMTGGADALPDYELLELLLFRAIRWPGRFWIASAISTASFRPLRHVCPKSTVSARRSSASSRSSRRRRTGWRGRG